MQGDNIFMRPVIKKKRIDPRYFLNETVNREKIEEVEPIPSPGPKEEAREKDDEEAQDAEECAPVNIVKKSKDSKKVVKGKKGNGKEKEKKVLFGEEELRVMVKEMIESFEENLEEATPAENKAEVARARSAKGMKQAASGEWYTDKRGHSQPVDPTEKEPGKKRTDDYLASVSREGAFTNKKGGGK